MTKGVFEDVPSSIGAILLIAIVFLILIAILLATKAPGQEIADPSFLDSILNIFR